MYVEGIDVDGKTFMQFHTPTPDSLAEILGEIAGPDYINQVLMGFASQSWNSCVIEVSLKNRDVEFWRLQV